MKHKFKRDWGQCMALIDDLMKPDQLSVARKVLVPPDSRLEHQPPQQTPPKKGNCYV